MEVTNAIIRSFDIEIEDHGSLTMWLNLDYGGSGQGFGGHALYLPESFTHHRIDSPTGHFIFRCLEIAGVNSVKDLPGKTLRVRSENGLIKSIGHIVEDKWFTPSEEITRG